LRKVFFFFCFENPHISKIKRIHYQRCRSMTIFIYLFILHTYIHTNIHTYILLDKCYYEVHGIILRSFWLF
jgi:hypothetical protein